MKKEYESDENIIVTDSYSSGM